MIKFLKYRTLIFCFCLLLIYSICVSGNISAQPQSDVMLDNTGKKEDVQGSSTYKANNQGKISKELKDKISKVSKNQSIPTIIWFKDINFESIEKKIMEKADSVANDNLNEEKRQLIKEKLEIKNKKYLSYFSDKEILFQSEFAPFFIVKLNVNDILRLAKLNDVISLSLFKQGKKTEEMAHSTPAINANYTRDTIGLDGTDIKIGVVEFHYADKENSELVGKNINFDVSDERAVADTDEHATRVASILVGKTVGLVPNATVYLAAAKNREEDYNKIEWLINQGVDVINYSSGYNDANKGIYSDMAKWIDYLMAHLNVVFVKSAGNDSSERLVTEPGMAYNVLTIGSIFENDSPNEPYWADDYLSDFSSYIEKEAPNFAYKPDMTAPGEGITIEGKTTSGTSWATPHVTAVIAQLLQSKPELKYKPCAVNAILKAGTMHKTATDYGCYSQCQVYSDMEGAGVVDAKGAYNIAMADNFEQLVLDNDAFPYTKEVKIKLSHYPARVALFWLKQNIMDNGNVVDQDLSDLDLQVINSDGMQVVISQTANNNTELVEFLPSTTGAKENFTIRVDGYSLNNNYEVLGLAWGL